ncbi:hypothetical protein CR513_18214, partial [Mucuna pruriens]
MGHPPFRCLRRPDAKCSRCNQIGYEAIICKANIQQAVADAQNAQENVQQKNIAQVADEEEEQLFMATCFAISNSSEKWLIDSVSKVKIGNGEHIAVKGKGTVAIKSFKVIFESDQCLTKDANDNEVLKVKMKGKSFALDLMKEEQKAFSATTIATSYAKPAKTHLVTRPLPSAGVVKDVDRRVIRRSGTYKEDT